ncbi:uncharacterized protein YebE (UPF0316 family) [Keratinibaculum paraultunense]|uniref:UPF0316 protein EDD65_10310 n=1 Tax=Keratinibaculum paraultunense TaxID=1278232 RepID=A0A4R3L120_9FIRM|nr:DUF2179 domain-containing protein [Keratinibaculum paraultunense]QQY80202.1 DUF2179 domain-containing protein [Keratinibaculum paraultunense]TCS90713.1 uncharacterized protein YebE (UPF0316 family) [Keratinibaculum paraultunense]
MFEYLIIFFARVVDVTLATIRTLMVVQGRKIHSAVIGFFEVSIYVAALGKVVSNLDDPRNLLAYALGFACGNYIGITIENRIALGNLVVQIVLSSDGNDFELAEKLRNSGFGVTILHGEGKEGSKKVLQVAINRKDLDKLEKIVYNYDGKAFITTSSVNCVSGGYFSTSKKK